MKTLGCFRWLVAAAVAASLPVTAQAAVPGHSMGGFAGSGPHHTMGGPSRGGRPAFMGTRAGRGRFFDHRFAGHDRFFDHDRDDHFFHHHHHNNFIFVFDFAAFGFPWWYPDYYYYPYYPYYPYDGYYGYGSNYDSDYWTNLAVSVQTKLADRGYYHGAIDGEIGSASREAIRAFQSAQGLPVTGLIDPKLLKALGIKYRTA